MEYRNAKNILPAQLVDEIQKYVQGQTLYIPRKTSHKTGWGEMNGTKAALRERNQSIMRLYRVGSRIEDIAAQYYLSPDSVRKIVSTQNMD